MAAYDAMYHKLFNAVTDAINILQTAQIETEGFYMDSEPTNLKLLKSSDDIDKEDDF